MGWKIKQTTIEQNVVSDFYNSEVKSLEVDNLLRI